MDEEQWKTIPEFRDYQISSHGRLLRRTNGKGTWGRRFIGTNISISGYYRAALRRNSQEFMVQVHRMVAFVFIGPPPSPIHEVRHLDGNKLNNHFSNLAWGTRADNEADKVIHGRSNRGERHGMSKLTESAVREMRRLRLTGMLHREIATQFNVSRRCVSDICRNLRWKHIT